MTTARRPSRPHDATAAVVPVDGISPVPVDEWDSLVARLGGLDTYTTAAYHRASARLETPGTTPLLLHFQAPGTRSRGAEVALPLLLRPLPDGDGWDATSAYGYGGPVARTRRIGPAFGAALDRWARANGVVTTFLRLHPLLGNDRLVPTTGEVVGVGSTVAWDVSPGRSLMDVMHPHHRRAVRRAQKAGLQVEVVEEPRSLDRFRELYETTMRRQGASPYFFFPSEYWRELLEGAGPLGLSLVEGRLDGELVAALLCFAHEPSLHYHLGASSDLGRSIGASNACFLAAAEWAQQRRMSHFHLGGGVGGSATSSLFVFKHRFDPESTPRSFHIAKLVHDRTRYEELAGTGSTAGFFPPWRSDE